jgi:GTP-binding protein
VTRDRIFAVCHLGEAPFEIIDTGGIGSEPDPEFAAPTRLAAEAAILSADLLLLVVDGLDGITPIDQDLARILRGSGKPVGLVVNKLDLEQHENLTADFSRLGFPEMLGVSAAHGRGVPALIDWIDQTLPPNRDETPPEALRPARIVLLGRPNVGKSSLTNAILGDERTIVSELAGTTRDAVDIGYRFADRDYVLCDTAGMRHRSRHNTSVEVFSVMRAERALRSADLCLLIIDASQGVTSQEKRIAQLIQKHDKPVLLVLNKWDLVSAEGGERRELLEENLGELRRELFFLTHAPAVALSARTGENVTRLFRAIEKIRQHATRHIGTGELNRHLAKCFELHPPPMRSNKRFKLLYATQVEARRPGPFSPPEIVLFVNHPKLLPQAYQDYLLRRIREKWEFPGLPIRLHLRGREERGKEE